MLSFRQLGERVNKDDKHLTSNYSFEPVSYHDIAVERPFANMHARLGLAACGDVVSCIGPQERSGRSSVLTVNS